MKKYLARISVVLWGFVALFFLAWFILFITNMNESVFSYILLIIPISLTVLAISFILTGTINVKKILAMCQDEK